MTNQEMRALPLRLPAFVAPMFLVSGTDLVVASCAAGLVGTYPTANARSPEQLDECLREIVDRLSRMPGRGADAPALPWAVNLNTHSSNTRLAADLVAIARYQPPIVITALGSPRSAIETVHRYGGTVIADVTTMALAKKAIAAGADGLACVCAGSGGHTGHMSPFAFVSAVREVFDGVVVLGGGISDGWGIAGAMAAGADFVYMGTRFIASAESMAAPQHKALVVHCSVDDLVVSDAITGAAVSWLGPSLPACLEAAGPAGKTIDHDSNAPPKKRWKEIFSAGQGVGATRAIASVADIVQSLQQEWDTAVRAFGDRAQAVAERLG